MPGPVNSAQSSRWRHLRGGDESGRIRNPSEIERGLAAFARSPNGGLIATGSALTNAHRKLIITLAAQHKLPAIYNGRQFVADGGLISYAPDRLDQMYDLVINLKTAKALGLTVPPSLLARVDEVIE